MNTSLIATALSFAAFLLTLVATFTPAWISSGTAFLGFFGVCNEGTCVSITGALENAGDGAKASAAFMIIGTFVLLAGSIIMLLGMKKMVGSMAIGGIVTIIGGLATLIGVAVFAGVANLGGVAIFSVSFGFAWLAVFLSIAAGVLAIRSSE